MIKVIKNNEQELAVTFPYDVKLLEKIRKVEGRKWESSTKSWIIPNDPKSINELKGLFEAEHIIWDASIRTETRPTTENLDSSILDFERYLTLKGYTTKTKKAYLGHAKRFLDFSSTKTSELTKGVAERYMYHLLQTQNTSHAFANQALSAIKLYYEYILKQEEPLVDFPRPKKEKKLPNILNTKEVMAILGAVSNLKHKSILYLTYSAGLRIGEVVRLKVSDIDSQRMLVHVRQGKGRKDRYTILSEVALEILRKYAYEARPKEWLFPGANNKGFLTERSVQKVFEAACRKAKINKHVTVHTLRHSFATHLLECGTDLRYIQELLGHANSKTTEIYTHVTQANLTKIRSPLDRIMKQE